MPKIFKGSVLVYTLLILLMLLVGGMTLATVVLVQQRGAISAGGSLNAFQAANDGFEDLTAQYEKNTDITLNELGGGDKCLEGVVTIPESVNVRAYTATFSKDGTPPVQVTDCATRLSTVDQVKVVATVGSSTRAIETAFGASQHFGWVKINTIPELEYHAASRFVKSPANTDSNKYSPEKICQNVGYETFTGACKTKNGSQIIQGVLNATYDYDNAEWNNRWIYLCSGWVTPVWHFDITDNSQILCGK